MTFLAPLLLLGLLLVPVLLGLYLWAQRRRQRYAVRFTNLDLLANLAPQRPSWRRHLPPVLYLAAVAFLVLGLARPSMVVAVPREDATVVLAIDVSGSMKATDVSPTRLDAARDAARSFVDQLPEGIRVGLVAFASRPITLVQPTADRTDVHEALDRLEALDGTAMGDALMQVLDIAERIQADQEAAAEPTPTTAPDATDGPDASGDPEPEESPQPADEQPLVAAILLSDGANSVGVAEPLDAAERAASLGVPIYTIALGTDEGRVTVQDDFGQPVTLDVPPDTETLKQVARISGGRFYTATETDKVKEIYANLGTRLSSRSEKREVTAFFAGGAVFLLLAASGLSLRWFGRLI